MGAAPGSMAGRLERGERNLSPGMSEKPRLASEAIEAVGVELKATENRADRAEIRADEARIERFLPNRPSQASESGLKPLKSRSDALRDRLDTAQAPPMTFAATLAAAPAVAGEVMI